MHPAFAYHAYEASFLAMAPARSAARFVKAASLAALAFGPNPAAAASCAAANLFERATRRYPKQDWEVARAVSGGRIRAIPTVELSLPFCDLVRFRVPQDPARPKLLLVAPMSGHHATLLSDAASRMLASFDVYATDWKDAKDVPLSKGDFGLDDYVDYVVSMLRHLGVGTCVMAVCQPSVPVLAAVALMSEDDDPCTPPGMVLMGGPVDVSRSPTAVNRLAEERGYAWFERNLVFRVPFPHAGAGRLVYPGFLQLAAFVSMNPGRHAGEHWALFADLASGRKEEAEKRRRFYDEYFSVMDIDARFYLDTILKVFVEHHLPEGRMTHRGRPVRPAAIRRTALMTVEGGRDDITGPGQTFAAHGLCSSLPESMRAHHVDQGAGHYGIFSGSRWRTLTAPVVEAFLGEAVRRQGRP